MPTYLRAMRPRHPVTKGAKKNVHAPRRRIQTTLRLGPYPSMSGPMAMLCWCIFWGFVGWVVNGRTDVAVFMHPYKIYIRTHTHRATNELPIAAKCDQWTCRDVSPNDSRIVGRSGGTANQPKNAWWLGFVWCRVVCVKW